jgi:selenocysteine-specific elongation factor
MSSRTVIVGTAGHIDHGKTSMVRALTGVELDTLPEERDRGITIALGFTALELDEAHRVALVDVPGHERLVRTMISGAHGLDAVLLVVSCMDGVMPQTREHLAILDLLGVHRGAVVLSKVDLADEEMRELAEADVEEAVEGTFLEGAPVVGFSAETGEGRDALLALLATFEPQAHHATGPFRLPVDRVFSRPGFGTVVTGSSLGGDVADGAKVVVLPGATPARIRGLQRHGVDADTAHGGLRVALNLAGTDRELSRGDVVTNGEVPCASIVDVRYRHVGETMLDDGMSVRLLSGTAERIGRIHLAGEEVLEAGESAFAQIRLDQPLPCLPGDRFVLRRTSPVDTLGGGVVLDPWAARMRKKDTARVASELARLEAGETGVFLERAGEQGLTVSESTRAGDAARDQLGDRVFAPTIVARLEGLLLEALATYHLDHPLALGAGKRELRRGRIGHLSDRVFDGLVERLASSGTVVVEGAILRATAFRVELSDDQRRTQETIVRAVAAAGLQGTDPDKLRKDIPTPELDALFHLLAADGALLQVTKVGYVTFEAATALRGQLSAHFDGEEVLMPVAFKDLTELTRRHAIPWLETLDRWGWTKRLAEGRGEGALLREGPRVPSIG